jgi:DNA-binding winged helix-turn-helix (wHTH) protein
VSYRFGRFVLDCDTRQLLGDGEEVHLSPKAFELLTVLLENRPRAMSKAELQERLWPSTFVEEANLAGLVAEIRRALDDSATQPAFLRTVYRFGYRFVGDVLADSAAPRASSGPRPCLIFQDRQFVLLEGANVIGRAPDAAVRCDATGVSRYHARILVVNGEATLEDLGSKNGTYLRRERVRSARLSDGDEIRLGTASLVFRLESPPGPTETVSMDAVSKIPPADRGRQP